MNILIIGTGIIGTIYGWALKKAGHEVTHFVRKGRSNNQTLNIDILDERKGFVKNNKTTYDMKATESIRNQRYDLVIIPANSHQVVEALKALKAIAKKSYFFIMSANWNGTSEIEKYLPEGRFILGYPDAGGTIKNGTYWVNIRQEIHLEKMTEENQICYHKIIEAFEKAGINPDPRENMLHWLWMHNASSIPLWVASLKHKNTEAFLNDSKLLNRSIQATKEVLSLLEKIGIDTKAYPQTSAFSFPKPILKFLMRLLYAFNKSIQRYTAQAANSFEEARANYYEILQTAKDLNFNMPLYQELEEYVRPFGSAAKQGAVNSGTGILC